MFPDKIGTDLITQPGFRVSEAARLVRIGKNMESFAVVGDYS